MTTEVSSNDISPSAKSVGAEDENLNSSVTPNDSSKGIQKTHRDDTKKCKLCGKNKALSCYYSKGNRWDSRCKNCIKKVKS